MFMVVLVVDDPNTCSNVLDAWGAAGVPGATVLDSVGMQRVRGTGARDDISLMPSLSELLQKSEIRHRTIFSVVRDREMVDRLAAVTQDLIGDFKDEHTGFMFTLKVDEVFGMHLP